jgi:hypothetical protein
MMIEPLPWPEISQRLAWCAANLSGGHRYEPVGLPEDSLAAMRDPRFRIRSIWSFDLDEDAVLFAMVWL